MNKSENAIQRLKNKKEKFSIGIINKTKFLIVLIIGSIISVLIVSLPHLYKIDWIGLGSDKTISTSIEDVVYDNEKIVKLKKRTEHIKTQKTLWDWVGLLSSLAVPIFAVTFPIQYQHNQQKKAKLQKELEEKRTTSTLNEEALQVYIDRMSELLVDKNFKNLAKKNTLRNAILKVAQTRTLSIARRLNQDGERKGSIVRFLFDAGFINITELGLDLKNVDFSLANLVDANLVDANLSGVNLSGADLSHSILKGAYLRNANLSDANLGRADLSGTKLNNANLRKANLKNADLNCAELIYAKLNKAILSRADLRNANLKLSTINNAKLNDANLSGTKLVKAKLVSAYLRNADLRGADLSDAYFLSANLRNVNFTDAKLSSAILSRADLSGAIFSGADLSGTKFWNKELGEAKNITPEQIRQAKNWEKAIYSSEFYKKLVFNIEV